MKEASLKRHSIVRANPFVCGMESMQIQWTRGYQGLWRDGHKEENEYEVSFIMMTAFQNLVPTVAYTNIPKTRG